MTKNELDAILNAAHEAGHAAATAHTPTPMIVRDGFTGYTYPPVMDGACGFGWITLPANKGIGRQINTLIRKNKTDKWDQWAEYRGWSRRTVGKGIQLWVSSYGQSYERKRAYAYAYADKLRELVPDCGAYAGSRLD